MISCTIPDFADDPFKDDIIAAYAKPVNFQFDPRNLPVIGVTKETDLTKMYPEGPINRLTYLKERNKEINKQKFVYDRIIGYQEFKKKEINEPGVKGYDAQESLVLEVFISRGTVSYFYIKHMVIDKNNNWIPGKYNQLNPKDFSPEEDWISTSYPGKAVDSCEYWIQRSESDRHKYVGNGFDPHVKIGCYPANPTNSYVNEKGEVILNRTGEVVK